MCCCGIGNVGVWQIFKILFSFDRNVPWVTLYKQCSSHVDWLKNMAARRHIFSRKRGKSNFIHLVTMFLKVVCCIKCVCMWLRVKRTRFVETRRKELRAGKRVSEPWDERMTYQLVTYSCSRQTIVIVRKYFRALDERSETSHSKTII